MKQSGKWLIAALLAHALACGTSVTGPVDPNPDQPNGLGDQIGDENPARCGAIRETALSLTEPSPLGFSAAQVLQRAGGPHDVDLTWATGETTKVQFSIEHRGGSITHNVNRWGANASTGQVTHHIAIDSECPDTLELAVVFTLTSQDGAFDERLAARLIAYEAQRMRLWVDLRATSGSFDPREFARPETDRNDIQVWLELNIDQQALGGAISGIVSRTNRQTSAAEPLEIAEFGQSAT